MFENQDNSNISFFPNIPSIIEVNKDSVSEEKKEMVTHNDLTQLEEKIDLKIKVAVQPIEGKIDNLPTQFKNMLLEERHYQDDKRKETQRYIWGTIIIGLAGILASVILHFL